MKRWYDEELGVNMCEPDCVSECLFHIWAIGCDYDGYETVDGLKSLVDELVELANKARMFLDEGKYYSEVCPKETTRADNGR